MWQERLKEFFFSRHIFRSFLSWSAGSGPYAAFSLFNLGVGVEEMGGGVGGCQDVFLAGENRIPEEKTSANHA